ncbi:MAG TPA: condensation domain-containing protein [Dehalococcoidia bacterium]|nr:condensation domain-containing protein [Dehalococcoidia bacterium]
MRKHGAVIPLNCIDKTLLSYEAAYQRLNFHLILSIEGKVDPTRLDQALLCVLQRYPTIRTVLRTKHFRHFRQVEKVSGTQILEIYDLDDTKIETEYEKCLSECINRPMDIKRGFPIKVFLIRKGVTASTLVFVFHHSAIDGIRAVRFIDEVISSYENVTTDKSLSSRDIPIRHKGDALIELARCERPATKRFYWNMLYYMFHFLLTTPFSHSARICHIRSGQSAEIYFCSGRVNSTETREIKSKAKSVGGTVNDILLAACFRTIEKWNRLHGKQSKKISIMVPVDIAPQEVHPVSTNQVSFLSVSTLPMDRSDPTQLLKKVNTQTVSALKQSRGCTFSYVYFSYVLSRFPLAFMKVFAKYVKFPVYADTVLHSNLGIRTLYGNRRGETGKGSFRVTDIVGLGPVITAMGMFLVIITYNQSLGIDLCYKTSCFSKEKAQKFLDLYLAEIKGYEVELKADQIAHSMASCMG